MKKLILFLTFTISVIAQNYPVGVNLVNDFAFVNIMNTQNNYQNVSQFDEKGWPMSDFNIIFDWRLVAAWNNVVDDPEKFQPDISGTYKCSFEGRADVDLIWAIPGFEIQNYVYNETENVSTFDMIVPTPNEDDNWGFFNLIFENSRRSNNEEPGTGIKNLVINRPNYDLDSEQTFTNEYLELCRSADFDCYRYYTVQNIWGGEPEFPEVTSWENRKLPDDAAQVSMKNTNGKSDGWCWEYIVELANILNKDIWICLHISQDENYVRNLAEYLKNNLNEGINIYLENSNEVWSPTFQSTGYYNAAQASEYGISFDENYARRTVEIAQIFADVFGEGKIHNKIRVVMGAQAAYIGRSYNHINYIIDNYGKLNEYIYGIAPALYFGSVNPNGNPVEINQGMYTSINEQLNEESRLGFIGLAEEHQLPGGAMSYEGGNHIPSSGNLDNLANQIEANRSEEMGEVIKYNYKEGWFDQGGGLACHFTLLGKYQRFGAWGLTDSPFDADKNYKFRAIRELAEKDETALESRGREILIYPNPAEEAVNLPEESEWSIFNGDGSIQESGRGRTIDVSAYPTGVYFIRIDGKIYKIIKR